MQKDEIKYNLNNWYSNLEPNDENYFTGMIYKKGTVCFVTGMLVKAYLMHMHMEHRQTLYIIYSFAYLNRASFRLFFYFLLIYLFVSFAHELQ